jgi:hypothetical protein
MTYWIEGYEYFDRIWTPFYDEELGIGLNGRSPAIARLLNKGDKLWEG